MKNPLKLGKIQENPVKLGTHTAESRNCETME